MIRRWVIAGSTVGALLALLTQAPAHWLAQGLHRASQGHLQLAETRGTVWDGSGLLVLGGGAGSRDASVLPDRLEWRLGLQGLGVALKLRQACCIKGELRLLLKPESGRLSLSLPHQAAAGDWLARFPAAWLGGLGTPWNTLQLGGGLRLSARDFSLDWIQGRWQPRGQLDLDFINLSSRVTTLAPLGSYRFSLIAPLGQAGPASLQLSTLEGALLLSGQGSLGPTRLRFQGEARAAPEREIALNNLLNIIGRRDGARSLISIG
ncbi:type II secretion system protein N [Roseateles sp.]|jgi:general secretion pathway protein N|uniref:type II secretion system protein N n=1 Tax=Roseateles sp. TaxID=1971397 RepID=UPI00391942E6